MEKTSTFEKKNTKPWKTQWIWSSGSGETQTVNHSETTARSKFQKKQGKSVVDPSGGGETAGILVFLGFQTGRLALFWRGVGTSSSFRAMVFSCRQLLFSKLFYCEQPQATESLEKGCFSRISDATLGSFLHGFGPSSSFRAMVFACWELIL